MTFSLRGIAWVFFGLIAVATAAYGYARYARYQSLERAQEVARSIGDPDVKIRFIGNTLIVEGWASIEERSRVQSIAEDYMRQFHYMNLLQKPHVLNLIDEKSIAQASASR